jgi:hypothetical protein
MSRNCCPLRATRIKHDVNETMTVFEQCIGEYCEWFIKETDECAIKCIATRLERGAVHVIWEKQPQPTL